MNRLTSCSLHSFTNSQFPISIFQTIRWFWQKKQQLNKRFFFWLARKLSKIQFSERKIRENMCLRYFECLVSLSSIHIEKVDNLFWSTWTLEWHLPYVDNHGHLTDHLPISSCPRSFWTTPCGTYFTSNICASNWCLILSKYVPNICQMAITVTSISDKDDVSCESSNSWYFRVSYLRSMHTSQQHSGLIGVKSSLSKRVWRIPLINLISFKNSEISISHTRN